MDKVREKRILEYTNETRNMNLGILKVLRDNIENPHKRRNDDIISCIEEMQEITSRQPETDKYTAENSLRLQCKWDNFSHIFCAIESDSSKVEALKKLNSNKATKEENRENYNAKAHKCNKDVKEYIKNNFNVQISQMEGVINNWREELEEFKESNQKFEQMESLITRMQSNLESAQREKNEINPYTVDKDGQEQVKRTVITQVYAYIYNVKDPLSTNAYIEKDPTIVELVKAKLNKLFAKITKREQQHLLPPTNIEKMAVTEDNKKENDYRADVYPPEEAEMNRIAAQEKNGNKSIPAKVSQNPTSIE